MYFYRLWCQKLVEMSHLHSTRLAYLEGDPAKGEVLKWCLVGASLHLVTFGKTFSTCTIGGRSVAVDNVDAFLGVHLTDAAVVVSNALEATWREWDAVLQASFWNPPSFDTRWCSFRGILVESYISLCRLQLSLWNPPSPNVRCSFGGILEESKISQERKFRISSLAHFQMFLSPKKT